MKNSCRAFLLALALILTFLGTTIFTYTPSAHASSRPIPHSCTLLVQNAGITERGPEYQVSGYNGTGSNSVVHMGQTRSVSNTVTATLGFSYAFISAQVGFNVTASTAVAYDYTITVPPYKTGHINAYADFYTDLLTNSCTHQQAVAYGFDGGIAYNGYIS